jgi:hypothetical protein
VSIAAPDSEKKLRGEAWIVLAGIYWMLAAQNTVFQMIHLAKCKSFVNQLA